MTPQVAPLTRSELDEALPLVAGYQRFYAAQDVDDARNAAFFTRFLAPSDVGLLLGARVDGVLAGFACLYWIFDSIEAQDAVLLGDLFVVPERRGTGVGRALIDAAAVVARGRGASVVRWMTAPDNHSAQALYDRTGASRSTWYEYELEVEPSAPA